MVKLTKIYTRTGDSGETHLAGGHRVKKTSRRMVAIGDIDELNSWFGMLVVRARGTAELHEFIQQSLTIQQHLFNLGAELAILPDDRRDNSPRIIQENIDTLEQQIDTMNADLPMLKSFILPGGNDVSATAHIARSMCRRAERSLFSLADDAHIEPLPIQYINRLSDWLFVAARFICQKSQVSETLWVT
ncbi:MAG: ATP:cob(I)alamin adenosyltransferase [Coxiella sp. (in: Bacteria)]|nr:MAG: ATP:cob(I)alamin adenosyltransferase [Coxiella sp. (in: g-proteobacteria)]